MADADWDASLAFVIAAEGGYSHDPLDPGGATNLGITLAELSEWRHIAVTKDDVKNLSREEAAAIYRSNYWNSSRCTDLPAGVDLMVFDASVNIGIGRSAKFLQAALGVTVDGSIGPQTVAAVRSRPVSDLIGELAARRLAFYQTLPDFNHFGAGWTNRVNQVQDHALAMAGSAQASPAWPTHDVVTDRV